jgi:hypothetical protein
MTDVDATIDRLLAGELPGPDAPAWCSDLAVLVRAAQAPAQPDELARQDEIVGRMSELRGAAGATGDSEGRPAPGVAGVIDLDGYRARHAGDRAYRAKHAAARLEASRHPAARTLGRVIAMKAVAVTTAVVIGVAAAAAATTGIVATVVVPALSRNEPSQPTPPVTADNEPDGSGTGDRSRNRTTAPEDELPQVACWMLPPTCVTTPAVAPPVTVPGTPTTTAPSGTTASGGAAVAPATTTTEAAPPPTTVPEPTTTTTAPEPTTTTVPEDPPTDPEALSVLSATTAPGAASQMSAPVSATFDEAADGSSDTHG